MFSSRDKHSDPSDDKHSDSDDDKISDSDEKNDSSDDKISDSDEKSDSSDDDTKHINKKKRDEQSEASSTSNKIFASHDKHTGYSDDKQSDSSDDKISDSDDKISDSDDKISDSDERSDDSFDDDTEHISRKKRGEQYEVTSTGKKMFASHDKHSGYSDDKHCGYSDDKQSASSDDKKSDSSDDDVKHISLKNMDDYLEQVGLLGDNQQITKKDTSAAFMKFAKGKNTVTLVQFKEILNDIADSKNLNVDDLKIKLKSVLPEIMESSVCGASSGGMSKSEEPRAN